MAGIRAKKAKKKERSVWRLIGALVVAIMFFGSTIGFVFFYSGDQQGEEEPYNYKGYDFIKTSQGWQTSTLLGQITAVNLPLQTSEVECDCSFLTYQTLKAQKAYVVAYSQAEKNAAAELLRNIPFGNIHQACLPEDADTEGCEDLPLKSCEDATLQSKVLIFKEGEGSESEEEKMSKLATEKVSFRYNCLTVNGENLIKAADKVIYKAFGIV